MSHPDPSKEYHDEKLIEIIQDLLYYNPGVYSKANEKKLVTIEQEYYKKLINWRDKSK